MSTRIAKPRGTCSVCGGPTWKSNAKACASCRAEAARKSGDPRKTGRCSVCGTAIRPAHQRCAACALPKAKGERTSYCACGQPKKAESSRCDRCNKQRMTTFRPTRAHVVEDCRHHYVLPPPDGPIALGVCKHCGKTKVHRNSAEGDYAPFSIPKRDPAATGVLGVPGKRRTR